MRCQAFPGAALIATAPDLAAAGAEENADRLARVGGHRLPLDGKPGLRRRQPGRVALPGLAAVDRTVDGGLAAGRDTRPDARAIHRKYPQRVRIARMQNHRKADITRALGHGRADVLPALAR